MRQYLLNGKWVTSLLDDDDRLVALDQWGANPWSAQGAYDPGPAAPAEFYPHDEAPRGEPAAASADKAYNGSGATTAAVAASGNQDIDGLLIGTRWAGGSITYSDPNSTADYQAGHPEAPFPGFSQVSAQQMIAVHFGLNSSIFTQPIGAAGFAAEGFTNLSLSYAGSGSGGGTIRVANLTGTSTAFAYYPNNGVSGGDAFFVNSGETPVAGNYDWHTVLHELGHSLGLKHGHEAGGVAGALPANVDSLEFSIMTYRTFIGGPTSGYTYEAFGAPQTFMMLDIAALQYMYGADYTTNSGNTVYTWSQTDGTTFVNGNVAIDPGGNRIFATIWDGGGTDTYDLSNYTTDLEISLAPGQWSTFSDTQVARLGVGEFARGNIANALLFGGNTASLIENATGGSGNDTIQGNDINNVLTGNAGDDTLKGFGGNDTLNGGSGNDTLKGGGGNDTLNGGDGNDSLFGEDGVDTANGGNGDDDVNDADFVNFDVYDGGTGVDTIDYSAVAFASGIVTINLSTGQTSVSGGNTEQITNFENVEGSDGGETIIGNSLANVLNGNDGNDVIDGGFGDDVIDGGVGNDTIHGGSGSDVLSGGDGNDTLFGGFFTDTVSGGNGDDTISVLEGEFGDDVDGGAGTDTLNLSNVTSHGSNIDMVTGTWDFVASFGGPNAISGIEIVNGTQLDDVIIGTFGVQTLNGNDGNDTLRGGFATDIVNGGNGDDTIAVLEGEFGDVVNGGSGTDTLDLSNVTTHGSNVNLDTGTWDFVLSFGGPNAITSIETVHGTQLSDVLTGTFGTQTLFGNGGTDRFVILDGRFGDNITGGAGADTLDLSPTNDAAVVDLAGGTYTIAGFAPVWTIITVENVLGTSAADTITGNAGNNVIDGGAGNDTVDGGAGNDTLTSSGDDTINGGDGNDRIFAGLTAVSETLDGGAGIDTLDTTTFNFGTYIINLVTGATNFPESFTNFENLVSGATNDVVTGTAGANSLSTGDGNDTVSAGAGADILLGGNGDDLLTGGAGGDVHNGGAGTDRAEYTDAVAGLLADLQVAANNTGIAAGDTYIAIENLWGTNFADNLRGNTGDNEIWGANGNDTISGRNGNDTLHGDNNNDILYGGAGADVLDGGTGSDRAQYSDSLIGLIIDLQVAAANTGIAAGDSYIAIENLWGTNFDDNLRGNAGNNAIWGSNGDDVIDGRNGNDTLNGGAGDDRLLGGTGNDRHTGGAGLDSFQFDTALNAATNVDTIFDFSSLNDFILLENSVFTNAGPVGTLAAGAFNTGATASDASDRILYDGATGFVRYDADGNLGGSAAIQFATLSTGLTINNTHFIVV